MVLPLISWFIISVWGQRLPGQGDRVGIGAMALALILSIGVLSDVMRGATMSTSFVWASHGRFVLDLGFQVDPMTAVMLVVVALVSLLVQIYSTSYMAGDVRYKRYYAVLSLFTASMFGLVLSDNLLFLFVFWEIMGLCSYMLIGHWFEDPNNVRAANKAFLTTRVGDVGLFIGIMLTFAALGSFRFDDIAAGIQAGAIAPALLTVAAVLIFAGAVGKSAQFPLHVWLPDAMAGPTPASSLIHAATMVAAGVYLVARGYAMFQPSAEAMTVVAYIGAFTGMFAASMGLVTEDIKRMLAFSTVSQLGLMFLALGVGGYTAAVFHLVTHAIFKALLFMCSGSVIHATGTQDMHEMGGLLKKMPITGWTWIIGAGALAGIPPLAGFWSKEEILLDAFVGGHTTLFWMGIITSLMTAFYITRGTVLVFFSQPRNKEVHAKAHESPAAITWPLLILGALAVVVGFVNSPLSGYALSRFIFFGEPHDPPSSGFVVMVATLTWVIGVAVALAIYQFRIVPHESIRQALYPVWITLNRRYWIDDVYNFIFVQGGIGLALVAAWLDRNVIDRIVNAVAGAVARLSVAVREFDASVIDGLVNGIAGVFVVGSRAFRRLQTGYLQSYALALFIGLVAGLLILFMGG